MEKVSTKQAIVKLSLAVLVQTVKDMRHGKDIQRSVDFAKSDWCEVLCELAEVNHDRYKVQIAEEYIKAVYGMKPKRIKTHMIAEVLKEWRRYS